MTARASALLLLLLALAAAHASAAEAFAAATVPAEDEDIRLLAAAWASKAAPPLFASGSMVALGISPPQVEGPATMPVER